MFTVDAAGVTIGIPVLAGLGIAVFSTEDIDEVELELELELLFGLNRLVGVNCVCGVLRFALLNVDADAEVGVAEGVLILLLLVLVRLGVFSL